MSTLGSMLVRPKEEPYRSSRNRCLSVAITLFETKQWLQLFQANNQDKSIRYAPEHPHRTKGAWMDMHSLREEMWFKSCLFDGRFEASSKRETLRQCSRCPRHKPAEGTQVGNLTAYTDHFVTAVKGCTPLGCIP
eukprot:1145653-Pelagomonas_calceolata.AAC.3